MDNKNFNKAYTSIVLSIFVCFIMIGAFVLSNGLKTSYALPAELDASNIDTLVTATEDLTSEPYQPFGNGTTVIGEKFVGKINTGSGETVYYVDMFCLEQLKGMPNAGHEYSKVADSTKYIDNGITYIVNKAYENASIQNNKITLSSVDYYNAQIAIWIYQQLQKIKPFEWCQQDECAVTPNTQQTVTTAASTLNTLRATWTAIQNDHASGNAKIIYDYITGAQAAAKDTTENTITITPNKVQLKLSDDKKYYDTDLLQINVTTAANSTFAGFTYTMNDNEYGTIIADENGNEITDYSTLANTKFKIRVPAEKLKAGTTAKVSGDLIGLFQTSNYLAYQFVGEESDSQQIGLLATSAKSASRHKLNLSVTVPDTGVDYSQYIYIIGAMVLVIGLTVIYVNTKAKEI